MYERYGAFRVFVPSNWPLADFLRAIDVSLRYTWYWRGGPVVGDFEMQYEWQPGVMDYEYERWATGYRSFPDTETLQTGLSWWRRARVREVAKAMFDYLDEANKDPKAFTDALRPMYRDE